MQSEEGEKVMMKKFHSEATEEKIKEWQHWAENVARSIVKAAIEATTEQTATVTYEVWTEDEIVYEARQLLINDVAVSVVSITENVILIDEEMITEAEGDDLDDRAGDFIVSARGWNLR